MLDRQMLALTKPLVEDLARRIHQAGYSANQVSFAGFGFGVVSALMIASGFVTSAVIPLAINRMCDGLDGAIARSEGPSDRGAFLDITLDFLFYAGIPLAFAFCNPETNALPAAVAEKRGEKSTAYPTKAFYYLGGLTEGTETITCFVLMCLMPDWFVSLAYTYAAMCTVTTFTRMVAGWQHFK
jgi:phosphatidylserine synthase